MIDCYSSCQAHAPDHGQAARYCGGVGRPSDVQTLADGSMLATDETNSLVYRITYDPADLPPPAIDDNRGFDGVFFLFLGCLALLVCIPGVHALNKKREKDAAEGSESIYEGEAGNGAEAAPPGEPTFTRPQFSTGAGTT